ncbi:MAG: hypothetical protein ACRECH_06430 [Nitrososphaerales archaeon]
MFKSRTDKISTIFAVLSGLMFLGAVGSAIYLSTDGMYLALALIFFGGFCTLMSAMVVEKSRATTYAKLKASEIEREEEALQ